MAKTTEKPIDSLTKEQEAMIPQYLERFKKIGLSTEPCDRAKAEDAIKRSYAYLKLAEPEIIWADSPFAGAVIAAKMANGTDTPTRAQIAEQADTASFGSFEAYWVAFYAFISEQLPVKQDPLTGIAVDIVENCGVYWTFEDAVLITEKPTRISMKDGKLHDPDQMALMYKDGSGICAVDGVSYPSLLEASLSAAMSKKESA